MRAIWQSLAWREWHEHKWKLASITAILCGISAFVFVKGLVENQDPVGLLGAVLTMCLVPLAVFVGLGSAASERSRGTFAFTNSLPVPMWQVAVGKLIAGFATLVASVLATTAVVYACTLFPPIREKLQHSIHADLGGLVTGSVFTDIALYCLTFAASFYIWAAAIGVNRKDEVSAGAVAVLAMVGWYAVIFGVWYLVIGESRVPGELSRFILSMLVATVPGGFVSAFDSREVLQVVVIAAIAVAVHVILLTSYIVRFGKNTNAEIASPKAAASVNPIAEWLGKPRGSKFGAIAWKQFRESVPLVAAGFAGLAACTMGAVAASGSNYLANADQFARMFAAVSIVMGWMIAIVIGIGVCLNDVSPGINTFWRSRPINSDAWFWTKFGTGLAVLLVATYLPMLAVIFLLHPSPIAYIMHPDSLAMAAAQIAIFAAAVLMTSLVRQAVYAAILSMASVYLGVLCGLGLWYVAGLIGWVRLYPHGWMEPEDNLPVALGMVLSAVVGTVIAWWAVRKDWGWKSR